ncbi:MAG: hypothetical protein HUJ74_04025 [Lachnospiraceae bacterium]|nr:hypothetical protein [Lachnospiraceae bacterium]
MNINVTSCPSVLICKLVMITSLIVTKDPLNEWKDKKRSMDLSVPFNSVPILKEGDGA